MDLHAVETYTPRVIKKQDAKPFCMSLPYIDWFLKFFHTYTHQEICNQIIITAFTTRQRCRHHTTLRNISFQKLHQPKAQQGQTRRAHNEENVTNVNKLVLS